MTKFSALIEKLQAAPAPDRELDCRIHLACGGTVALWHGKMVPEDSAGVSVPDYTASIDAALALVPEGEKFRPRKTLLAVSESGKRFAAVIDNWAWGQCKGEGPNYAIAMCIAALRAREEP